MALDNLISFVLTQAEETTINTALAQIDAIMRPKVKNLTPEERKRFARINNRTANWVVKVQRYMTLRPELVPFYVDKAEFDRDVAARTIITRYEDIMRSMLESIEDTNMLLSTDVYHNAIAFYRNVKNAAKEDVPGMTSIYQDLQEQFPGKPKSMQDEQQPDNEESGS